MKSFLRMLPAQHFTSSSDMLDQGSSLVVFGFPHQPCWRTMSQRASLYDLSEADLARTNTFANRLLLCFCLRKLRPVAGEGQRPDKMTSLLQATTGNLRLRCTCRFGHWRVGGGTCLRVILIVGHEFTFALYSFFEFLADFAGRLLRHAASFEKENCECQTDCTKTSHPLKAREMEMFLQSRYWRFQP
jgi:hypothetical protein